VSSRSLAAGFALALLSTAYGGELAGKVVRVHDGDTLTVLIDHRQIRVRLVEIDAPELGQAFGRRSRDS
jgi:micrococcal nuclease